MVVISKNVSRKIFKKYLDNLPDDQVIFGMNYFAKAVSAQRGALILVPEGGYEIHFGDEQDMLIFLLKWR
jgi:hypothetical protein